VINQSYENLEILVVNDGSVDNSGSICDAYAERDRRMRVFHTENHGLSAARNYALDRATGDYIAFLDSDDWLEADAYSILLKEALDSGADIVHFRFYQEFVNKTIESSGSKTRFVVEGNAVLKALLSERRVSDDVWDKFYKASLFKTIRYPEGRIFEDKAATYQLVKVSKNLVYLPDCLIHYRNRNNSLSNIHSMKSLVDYWLAYRERFESLGSLSREYYQITLAEAVSAISRMWRWYSGCSKEEKLRAKKYLDEMQQFVKEHGSSVMHNPAYSKHVRLTCLYARSQSPICFRLLYLLNQRYRSFNKDVYFEE
jgi:glycosyltransferase involved in cell wall biosynthesis